MALAGTDDRQRNAVNRMSENCKDPAEHTADAYGHARYIVALGRARRLGPARRRRLSHYLDDIERWRIPHHDPLAVIVRYPNTGPNARYTNHTPSRIIRRTCTRPALQTKPQLSAADELLVPTPSKGSGPALAVGPDCSGRTVGPALALACLARHGHAHRQPCPALVSWPGRTAAVARLRGRRRCSIIEPVVLRRFVGHAGWRKGTHVP